jgi:hypothetical protein
MLRELPLAVLLVASQSVILSSPAQPLSITTGRESVDAKNPPQSFAQMWRRHPSYQVFSSRMVIPEITARDALTLGIGSEISFKLGQLLEAKDQQSIAAHLGVSPTLFSAFRTQINSQEHLEAQQAARQLKTSITDYFYLREQWNRYHPPPDRQKAKAEALAALEAGDIQTAWRLFGALPRPEPPRGLRVTPSQ